jgi:hypothetical protein
MVHRIAMVTTALVGLTFGLGIVAARAAAQTCVTDTTAANFASGSLDSCYVGERAAGEVLLAPTQGTEFSGSSLPAGWSLFDWNPPDGATNTIVGGGGVAIDSARINPSDPAAYGFGRSLEFVATFRAEALQHAGFGGGTHATIYTVDTWAMFSTLEQTSDLYTRVNNGSTSINTAVAVIDGLPHRYRIDWGQNQVDFYIDGVLKRSDAITISATMRPALSDFTNNGVRLTVDWLRMTPYASPCTFESRVFDGGNNGADWGNLDASTLVPGGTGVTIETRSGNTPSPDMSWSPFQTLSGNAIQSPNARYLQYRATLTSSDPDETPELEDAEVCYAPCTVTGPEVCDGADNDCNGQIDEGTDGTPCDTGLPGVCADSTSVCNAGVLECPQVNFPTTDICNTLDDDCDGTADEGGLPCDTGVPGVCAAGVEVCSGGMTTCPQVIFPTSETCNTLDDDCDGTADEGNPGGGGGCATGQLGVCSSGTLLCSGGTIICQPNASPSADVCNGLDDDCDGDTDEGTSGAACLTGELGVCAPGTEQCQSGVLNCVQNVPASSELCETGQDEDCNGQTDEPGCLCAMADTVLLATQTRVTKLKLKDDANRDKLLAKGAFRLPLNVIIDPGTEVVRVRVADAQGVSYEGTIPPGNLVSPDGRRFKLSDPTLTYDRIKTAKISIGSDQRTVKYFFKAQDLDLPAFTPGTGSTTVIVGTRCFKDSGDSCTLSGSGSVTCR